jgi:hypothetical protein
LLARGFFTAVVAAPILVFAAVVDLAAADDSLFTAEVSAVFCKGLTLALLEASVVALAAAAAGLGAALTVALGIPAVLVAAVFVAAGTAFVATGFTTVFVAAGFVILVGFCETF